MRNIPPRVSEEQLPWVQVTVYHPHNSVNLPRDCFLLDDGLGDGIPCILSC